MITKPKAKTVDELFQQIREVIANEDGQFIFRGEAENYDLICSTFARDYMEIIREDMFSVERVQKEELEEVIKSYTDLSDEGIFLLRFDIMEAGQLLLTLLMTVMLPSFLLAIKNWKKMAELY